MCLQPDHISRILRLGLVEEVIFSYCLAFPRLAIALLVFRVFAVSRRLRIVLFGHSIFMLGVMCSTGGALFAMCSPRRKFWNPAVPGTCWSYSSALAVGYVNGGWYFPIFKFATRLSPPNSCICPQRLFSCISTGSVSEENADVFEEEDWFSCSDGPRHFVSIHMLGFRSLFSSNPDQSRNHCDNTDILFSNIARSGYSV